MIYLIEIKCKKTKKVWFQNRRSKERRMKQQSAMGNRNRFYRGQAARLQQQQQQQQQAQQQQLALNRFDMENTNEAASSTTTGASTTANTTPTPTTPTPVGGIGGVPQQPPPGSFMQPQGTHPYLIIRIF